jgi:hypothetical protein
MIIQIQNHLFFVDHAADGFIFMRPVVGGVAYLPGFKMSVVEFIKAIAL